MRYGGSSSCGGGGGGGNTRHLQQQRHQRLLPVEVSFSLPQELLLRHGDVGSPAPNLYQLDGGGNELQGVNAQSLQR
jgi:hypothetical protein